jgi:hypothetical protein
MLVRVARLAGPSGEDWGTRMSILRDLLTAARFVAWVVETGLIIVALTMNAWSCSRQ